MATTASTLIGQRQIDAARRRFPRICAFGIVPFRSGRLAESIAHDIKPGEIATAIECLSQLDPTKTGRVDSYRLKHLAEEWGRRNDQSGYVSNGALIVAALAIGLVVEPCGPAWAGSPNVLIGVSAKSVRRMIAANEFVRQEKKNRMA